MILKFVKSILTLPRRVAKVERACELLLEMFTAHSAQNLNSAHTTAFWRDYAARQRKGMLSCPDCAYAWHEGMPEIHFHDDASGERCPRYKTP